VFSGHRLIKKTAQPPASLIDRLVIREKKKDFIRIDAKGSINSQKSDEYTEERLHLSMLNMQGEKKLTIGKGYACKN